MANTIEYVNAYVKMLDLINKKEACTSFLESNGLAVKFDETDAQVVKIYGVSFNGLGTYSRANGYPDGSVDSAWQTFTMAMDRGTKIPLDALDAKEAYLEIMFLAAEFQRTKVVPEVDAYRFSKICTLAGIDVAADLTYDTAIAAIDTGIETLDDAECPQNNRVCFVSNNMYKLLKNSGELFNIRLTTQNNGVVNREIMYLDNMPIVRPAATVFKTAFTFSATDGFTPAGGVKDINFMICDAASVMAVNNYNKPKIITPELNADGDGFIYGYRIYHDLFIPDAKLPNVYIHTKA